MLESIKPKGKQKDVLALPPIGHAVILGTAGSGKTTMALLRAIALSKLPEHPKVLVVTFNQSLVQYMKQMMQGPDSSITVENYHKFARGYLNSRGKMPQRNGIAENHVKENFIREAVTQAKAEFPQESTFKRPIAVFVDEIAFIERFGFQSIHEYIKSERIGRASANIKRENRKWFYQIYERYLALRNKAGYAYDWDDLALYAYRNFLEDKSPRLYSHIIVDEGQDFSPIMLRSLTEATPPDGSFTFFGDVAQQIYGSRLSWRDAGIRITDTKIWKFNRNYRNPKTITKFAQDITTSEYWASNIDMVPPQDTIANGPKPVLLSFSSEQKELTMLIKQIRSVIHTSSNLIVLRTRAMIDQMQSTFAKASIPTTEITKETPGFSSVKRVYLSTFHSAKGLEFDNVYIPLLSDDIFPDPELLKTTTDELATLADELKLLYVAVTRSKYGLYMSYHGTLSRLFPIHAQSYDLHNGDNLK